MSALNWQPRRGDVVLVQFPFLESTGTAQRLYQRLLYCVGWDD